MAKRKLKWLRIRRMAIKLQLFSLFFFLYPALAPFPSFGLSLFFSLIIFMFLHCLCPITQYVWHSVFLYSFCSMFSCGQHRNGNESQQREFCRFNRKTHLANTRKMETECVRVCVRAEKKEKKCICCHFTLSWTNWSNKNIFEFVHAISVHCSYGMWNVI